MPSRGPSMASISDLPPELLDAVLLPLSIPDISRLSRTSRSLRICLYPRVYHTIDWFWYDCQPRPPFALLLRTVMRNDRLASSIKSLKLRGGGWWGHPTGPEWPADWFPAEETSNSWAPLSAFTSDDIGHVRNIVSRMYRPLPHLWLREFKKGNVDVLVALLLSRLSSLERLDLDFRFLYQSQFLPEIFRHEMISHPGSSSFSHLKSIGLALDVPQSPMGFSFDLDLLRPFFFLPLLNSISAVFPEPVLFAWPGRSPTSSSLSTLELCGCDLSENTLANILSSTPALRCLTYDHYRRIGENKSDWEYFHFIRCRLLDDALRCVQHTLQQLTIRVRFTEWHHYPVTESWDLDHCIGSYGRLSSLRTMNRLSRLEIPWPLLFGWEADGWNAGLTNAWTQSIPSTLESLSLRDDMHNFATYTWSDLVTFNMINSLLVCQPESFMRLKSISFLLMAQTDYDDAYHFGWWDSNVNRLLKLVEENNISCTISRQAPPWPCECQGCDIYQAAQLSRRNSFRLHHP